MPEHVAEIIKQLKLRWIKISLGYFGIISFAGGILITVFLHLFFRSSFSWLIPICTLLFTGILIFNKSWRISNHDIARWLDIQYPAMEESSALLLRTEIEPGTLQEMQKTKTEERISGLYADIRLPGKTKPVLKILLCTGVLVLALEVVAHYFLPDNKSVPSSQIMANNDHRVLPAIQSIRVRIRPPSYTNHDARSQSVPEIIAEEGSDMDWEIKTDLKVNSLEIIFNDSLKTKLQPKDSTRLIWGLNRQMKAPGFYQLAVDSQVTEHYKLEMIHDEPPEIEVLMPKSKTVLEYGMSEEISVRVSLRDDYGVRGADIRATISSGNGDAVKFSEKQIQFDESFRGSKRAYTLQQTINLNALGMTPGDELYFYVRAVDNHGQEKKSDVFIVTLADTTDLMSSDLTLNGMNVKPEYFRSERQIILETEQLLSNRRLISTDFFQRKSGDLGIDQKLLRLRYGKFLGEEDESNELGAGGTNRPAVNTGFGNGASTFDAYTDKHDNAEDAGFFEKNTKDQLKATLNEMWNAELHLRTYKPDQALPFEYKALRLLKDLQQKSRVYVAKTGIKTTALDLAKRLTGEQEKIIDPVTSWNAAINKSDMSDLREMPGVLQIIANGRKPDYKEIEIMQSALKTLKEKAIQEPSKYLDAYVAMQRILTGLEKPTGVNSNDRILVERAIQHMIKPGTELPYKQGSSNNMLSDYYFRNLKSQSE